MMQICMHLSIKVWIMCCLNLGSVLNIYEFILDFLLFAKDFEQNIWDSTRNKVLNS